MSSEAQPDWKVVVLTNDRATGKAALLLGCGLLLTALVVVVALVVVLGAARIVWPATADIRIQTTHEGASIVVYNGEVRGGTFFLHASQLWADSGIVVPPGASVSVTASGRVYLAGHELVDAALYDVIPPSGWWGPQGQIDPPSDKSGSALFPPLLVDPGAPPAMLLAALVPVGELPPSAQRPRPEVLFRVGSGSKFKNSGQVDARLMFVVNDGVVEFSGPKEAASKEYYIRRRVVDPAKEREVIVAKLDKDQRLILAKHEASKKAWQLREFRAWCRTLAPSPLSEDEERFLFYGSRWRYLKEKNYQDVFYDDNIGGFAVSISLE